MSLFSADLPVLLCLCTAAFPFLVLCAAAAGQSQPDQDHKALVARIDAARGAAKAPAALAIEGTFAITFAGVPVEGTELKGKFREAFSGDTRARHESDLGEHGVMESGITEDLVWEIDPASGAKVHGGVHALALRRWFAILRGTSPSTLYRGIARTGTQTLDGRGHVVLRMTPPEGKPDTWYVDPETGSVSRIDIVLPASDGAQQVWGMEAEVENQVVFGDWKKVDGFLLPHRRAVKMGPATITFTCAKVEASGRLDPARFTPPEAVLKAKASPASQPADGAPYQVIEREAQPVASIRVKCKPIAISATLAVLLPEVIQHLHATGAKVAGPPFARYHAFSETEIDLEAGFPVMRPMAEKGRIKNSTLPTGKIATAWHTGPYEKLGDAHKALMAWAQAQKLEQKGGQWEVYWTDPGMVPDPAKWRTQLFLPVGR